jgi:hypothetical protein
MATYTNLNNEIFGRSAIEGLTKTLFPLLRFARDNSPATGQRGDQVLVPLISTLTATTFNGSYAVCGGVKTVATINLTRHKHVPVGQDDITYHSSSEANLKDFGFQMGKALGTLIMTDVLSLVTTANFSSAGQTTLSSFDPYQIRQARKQLNKADVPLDPRAALVDTDLYDVLLGVTPFNLSYAFADRDVTKEGKLMRAFGMDFFEINGLFNSTYSVAAFAAHPDAIVFASRYLAPQAGNTYVNAIPITDPETGLTVGLREHYDNNTGTAYVNLECLYGFTVGLTNCGRILKRLD